VKRLGGRDFTLFWAVETLSTFGSSFSLVAVPLLVLHATGSVAQMGLLTGTSSVAGLLAGVFAGGIADRFDRKRLLITANIAQALLFGTIPAVWLFAAPIWLLYVVVPLTAVFAMLFRVTYVTVVPRLVDADQITDANGRLSASFAATGVVGPVLAGLVSGQFGPATAIGVDAVSFALAAGGMVLVQLRPAADSAPAEHAGWWRDLLIGASFLWRHPVLRSLTILLTALIFFWQGLVDLFIFYLKHDLAQPDQTVGSVMAAATAGTLVGALGVARLRRRIGFGASWIGSTVLAGVAVAAVAFTHSVIAVALLATAAYALTAVGGICSMSLRQEVTPDPLLGRVTAAFWSIHFALGPIGAAAVTALAAKHGVTTVIGICGAAYMLIAALATLTPIRQPHPERIALEPA
jgi:MFS family permease